MFATAREGFGFRLQTNHCSQRQRRQRPITILPETLVKSLKQQLKTVKVLHDNDLKNGLGKVEMPFALDKKYPNAGFEFKWQYVFPSHKLSCDPRTGKIGRHHIDHYSLQKAFKRALEVVGIENKEC